MKDLNSLDTSKKSQQGVFLHLNDLDGNPLMTDETNQPIGFTVIGSDSKTYQSLSHKHQNSRINRIQIKGGRIKGLTAEETEQEASNLLAKCITRFHNIVLDGEELVCTPENCLMLFERFPLFREQVDAFVHDRSNFLGESSPN